MKSKLQQQRKNTILRWRIIRLPDHTESISSTWLSLKPRIPRLQVFDPLWRTRIEAKVQLEGKRPKLVQEESTASSGSLGSQTECQDPPHNGVDSRQPRFESRSSVGPNSSVRSTSGLPSPSSITSGPPISRTGISSIVPLGTASPVPASPSTPSFRRESSTASSFQGSGHVRPSIESYSEQTTPLVLAQQPHRILTLDSKDSQTAHNFSQGLFNQTRSPRRTSPLDPPRRSTRIPTLLHHNTSDESSKSSNVSALSNASTAATSLFTPVMVDEEKKAAMSLPPLSMVTRQPASGNYFDSKRSHESYQLANPVASSYAQQQSSHSPFSPASSTGMKFESLQLPLPYNISFGQRPLLRPKYEEKLANIYDIQDVNRERHSLRNLTLDQDHSGPPTSAKARSLPEPQHPPHRPGLPILPSMSRDDPPDHALPSDADPLSVLAYAGRIVGREIHRPPS